MEHICELCGTSGLGIEFEDYTEMYLCEECRIDADDWFDGEDDWEKVQSPSRETVGAFVIPIIATFYDCYDGTLDAHRPRQSQPFYPLYPVHAYRNLYHLIATFYTRATIATFYTCYTGTILYRNL